MKTPFPLLVNPAELRLPWSRASGADPFKLARQISQFGRSTSTMPLIEVTRGKDGILRINNGVTRATRVAKLAPGTIIEVLVTEDRPTWDFDRLPTVGDRPP